MGVGLANSLMSPGQVFGEGVNWAKAQEVFSSLLISPVIGFVGAGLLLLAMKALVKRPELYRPPAGNAPPPPWIRGLLMFTCTGVSFFHGSNDGQKGMGLVVLILVGILPAQYALTPATKASDIQSIIKNSDQSAVFLDKMAPSQMKGKQADGRIVKLLKGKRDAKE